MSQVDFYLLSSQVKDGKLKMACRLGNKIVRLGKRIYVYTEDDATTRTLDQLMWTYSDTAFVPHECRPDPGAAPTGPLVPLVISHHPPDDGCEATVLISLAMETPSFRSQFERIAEIVDCDEREKEAARHRFKAYRDEGFTVNHHHIEL